MIPLQRVLQKVEKEKKNKRLKRDSVDRMVKQLVLIWLEQLVG